MNFKRWYPLAAIAGSLTVQAVSLAQTPCVHSAILSIMSQAEEAEVSPSQPSDSSAPVEAPSVGRRIVIQLPNGETREIMLPEGGAGRLMDPQLMLATSLQPESQPTFVIGVSLSEVPDSLRAHVALPKDAGVMVGNVIPDGPAAQAGLQKYDILLKAGDKELKHPKDLQVLVDVAEIQPLSITLQRHGEQKILEVTPIKREDLKFSPGHLSSGMPSIPMMGSVFVADDGQLMPDDEGVQGFKLPPMPMMNTQQTDALTESIRKLTEQVEHLQQAVDRLERKQTGGDLDKQQGNRVRESLEGEADVRVRPRPNLLTSSVRFS